MRSKDKDNSKVATKFVHWMNKASITSTNITCTTTANNNAFIIVATLKAQIFSYIYKKSVFTCKLPGVPKSFQYTILILCVEHRKLAYSNIHTHIISFFFFKKRGKNSIGLHLSLLSLASILAWWNYCLVSPSLGFYT